MTKKQKKNLIRIIITGIGFLILQFLNLTPIWNFVAYFAFYLIISYDVLIKAVKGIFTLRFLDENFLMSVATLGAFALSIYDKADNYNEALAVMFLYQIGELFESYAVGKSRKSITELIDLRPDYANIIENEKLVKKDPFEIEVGSIIVVNPGEKIPLDGVVVEGQSSVDTSAITGESMPIFIEEDDSVYSGCINLSGQIKIKTQKEFEESTASKLVKLVEEANAQKSSSEQFITKFARFYTPIVCALALLLAILPPIANIIMKTAPNWDIWIYRSLTFLVISCPCALVISIPLTFFAGIGGASRKGILIKGSDFVEKLSKISQVIMDKTGTLTEGIFKVVGIHHNKIEENQILYYAAHAESASSHPIAKSIKDAYAKEIHNDRVSQTEEIAGKGIKATVDGKNILIGNEKLMNQYKIDYIKCSEHGTVLHVAMNGEYLGHILISDAIKENAKDTIDQLHNMNIKKLTMLTGDKYEVAQSVANKLKIDNFYSELLPEQKLEIVKDYISKKEKVLFVGDGLNDAPSLSIADVGMAMGSMGVDASIEAADVVIMDDDPKKIPASINISRKIMRIVYENITGILFIKIGALILGALGIIDLKFAVFADVGVMILAVLNSIRALKTKNI
ncbi:MAG: heavy metal translocating P-type ATPase [Clostridia bacterium]|nr:heavy metal translocating P-type ATPase [Clostridia bacterium]